jgi:two-component system, NtrC family, sensor kinase
LIFLAVVVANKFVFTQQRLPLIIVVSLLPPLLITTHFLIPGKMRREKKNFSHIPLYPSWSCSYCLFVVSFSGIGRVILNLVNNPFYAVHDRSKTETALYQPTVRVTTTHGENIRNVVSDNGKGSPEKNCDKIFQPFFTTKPSGEGTGLGLSLSYNIITKGHGGSMKVESKEGEGTSFIIEIPL